MARFLLRRLLMLIATLLVSSFLIYSSLYLAPGNPIATLSGGRALPPASVAILEERYHLDKPFLVRAIWNDGQFTYLQTEATELPALYEVKDGDPALVNFQVHEHTYVVPKVLDRGYLALGKARFEFSRGR